MNFAIIGTGYGGVVSAPFLADFAHQVSAMDTDRKRIERLRAGQVPFYQLG